MQVVEVKAQKRETTGKAAARTLRRTGVVPAIIYGGDTVELIAISPKALKNVVYSPDFKLLNIDVDGTKYKCIIKELEFHPVSDELLHADFLRLVDGHPVKVEVPVRFEGVSPGVKNGGKLIQTMRRVKIKCMPENIVDELVVNIGKLKMGESVRVRDLQINEGIELITNGATPVANVEVPRALKSAEAAAALDGDEDEETSEVATEGATAE